MTGSGGSDAREGAAAHALLDAGARVAFVHGSRAGTPGPGSPPRPTSDLDVAAWWGGPHPAPWEVDLPPDVDLVVLDELPGLRERYELRRQQLAALAGG